MPHMIDGKRKAAGKGGIEHEPEIWNFPILVFTFYLLSVSYETPTLLNITPN